MPNQSDGEHRGTDVAPGTPRPSRGPFPQQVGLLQVAEVVRLTPGMQRVVFTGPALADLVVEEPGEIITLIWPADGGEPVLPDRGRWRFPDGAPEQHIRNYTARSVNPAAGRLTIDFFLHEEPGRAGNWAAGATPGDTVGFGGVRTHWVTDPAAGWSLLVADETGLPALAAIAETRPAGHRTLVVAEVRDAAEGPVLPPDDRVELHVVHRGGRPPGRGSGLSAAVAAVAVPAGRGQVWAAAETRVIADLRAHLLGERGVPRDALNAIGYWHRDAD